MYVCVRVTVCHCHNPAFVCPDSRCMREFLSIRTWSPASQLSFDPLPQDVPVRSASQHPSIHPSSKIFLVYLILCIFSRRETLLKREKTKVV